MQYYFLLILLSISFLTTSCYHSHVGSYHRVDVPLARLCPSTDHYKQIQKNILETRDSEAIFGFSLNSEKSVRKNYLQNLLLHPPSHVWPLNDNVIDEVFPGLFIGSKGALTDNLLLARHITHILALTHIKCSAIDPKIEIKVIPLHDIPSEQILPHFEEAFAFINSASEGSTLVLCAKGHSRSASFVIGYLMYKFHAPFKQAHDYLLSKHAVWPNEGFMTQLHYYDLLLTPCP